MAASPATSSSASAAESWRPEVRARRTLAARLRGLSLRRRQVAGRLAASALVLMAVCVALPLRAEPVPAPVQAEVRTLLDRLASSDCRFKRNGSWHGAAEARDHLQRKYEYLAERDAIGSTEQFIDRAASRSSVSGRPYWVQCAGRDPVASRTWLTTLLRTLRAQPAAPR